MIAKGVAIESADAAFVGARHLNGFRVSYAYSPPPLLREAMQQLMVNPPAVVIVDGMKEVGNLDGLTNRERVPSLFDWVDQNYSRRTRVGRFVVATK